MKRRIKTVVALTTLTLTASASFTADACDRGGRRFSLSRGPIGLPFSTYKQNTQPVYSTPVYSQPVYSQPVYSQPAYSQPTYSQPAYAQPTYAQPAPSQPTYGQPGYAQPGFPQSNGVSQQPAQSQPPQQVTGAPVTGGPGVGMAGRTAPSGSTTVSGPRLTSAPSQNGTPPQSAAVSAAPRGAGKPTSATTRVNQPASTGPTSEEASALQLLASMSSGEVANASNAASVSNSPQIPEFQPTDPEAAEVHVGTWTVSLPGNQSVQLVLNGNGSFVWTATKEGKSNTFDGQYRLENDRLTLVRSNDLQQMAGSWTAGETGFTFKLDGANNGGLAFTKG